MDWTDTTILAFDTETTGLNPWSGDRLWEFAGVSFQVDERGGIIEDAVQRHHFLFDPGIPIPRAVQELTGITDDDVRGKPSFSEQADEIRALLSSTVTVAHNYDFDQSALAAEFSRIGQVWPTPLAEIDTLDLSRRFFPEAPKHKLIHLATRLEVSLEGAHRAVNDAEACGRAFLAMTRRFDAPSDLEAMVDWADAIGRPPEAGPFGLDDLGRVVFRDGPHQGDAVAHHPDYLGWMLIAQRRVDQGWQLRFPESVRRWAARWLRIRGAGRAIQGGRQFSTDDWAPDSCARKVD